MFERFTQDARDVVVGAQDEARRLRHRHIGGEHLLLAILAEPTSTAGGALTTCGMTWEATRRAVVRHVEDPDAQAAALETIGIDLNRVRASVESAFGEGALERAGRWRRRAKAHIPFTADAKKALEVSLREALRLKDRSIGTEHILLGLLREGRGIGAIALREAGVDRAAVEAALAEEGRRAS